VYFRKSPDAYYLTIPQLILAVLALTTYHVQIITRIASGYPWWYIWLAAERPRSVKIAVRWMALYALIQGGLYASFLPPA
jgi:GPI mannosyltransferase 2